MSGGTPQSASRTALIALGLAALLGVAVAGGSVFDGAGTEATTRDALPYAALGATVGLVLAAIVIVTYRRLSPDSGRPTTGQLLGAAFVVAVVGALIGTALTPRSPTADEVSPLDDAEIERRSETLDLDPETVVRPIDADGDGQIDLDAHGNPILAYDEGGDGTIDGYLRPCPDVPTQTASFGTMRSSAGSAVGSSSESAAPLDVECDGEVDRYLDFDPTPFTTPPAAAPPHGESPVTISPDERSQRARDEGAGARFGSIARNTLIGLALLTAIVALAIARRRSRRRHDDGDPVDVPTPPTDDVDGSIAATIVAMERAVEPRQAICEAYGTLLAELAAIGLPRRMEEAPAEHVRRCLHRTDLDVASVTELIDLFGMARFSTHPVTEHHREAALRCLSRSLPRDRVATAAPGSWPPPPGQRT